MRKKPDKDTRVVKLSKRNNPVLVYKSLPVAAGCLNKSVCLIKRIIEFNDLKDKYNINLMYAKDWEKINNVYLPGANILLE